MKTFKDNAGRTWTVAVNVDAVKRCKSLAGVDLMQALEGDLMQRLSDDPILLCDVLYAICKPEADKASVSDEQFGAAMAGDAIALATEAMLEEIVDFFPPARRQLLGKALAKMRKFQAMALAKAEEKIDGPEMEAQLKAALDKLGN